MDKLRQRYSSNLALLTDLYQLTMAYGYWKAGRAEEEAVFYVYFRKHPFDGDYAIAAGLDDVIDFLENFHFEASDIAYLATLKGSDGKALFETAFLDYLSDLKFTCHLDAVPEGTVVFANTPLLRVQGSILQGQLLETALLNCINFQTLIASKAARIVAAAKGDPVLEFGLRRAQGIDGALSASRAAYIGGCHASSNVLAGKIYDIPVKGTHAHSWVMSFETEREAFEAYAAALPNNTLLLVDTYDSIKGIQKAIEVGLQLEKQGHIFLGIRLDSGDLAQLSSIARKMLNEAGLHNAKIVASDGLDEFKIQALKDAGAKIDIWGVGTNLVTAYSQASLGGVYKLAAIKNKLNNTWDYKLKLSDTPAKISTPGLLQVRRFHQSDGLPFGDMIWNEGQAEPISQIQSFDGRNIIAKDRPYEDLLQAIFRAGQLVYNRPNIHAIRQHRADSVALFAKVDFSLYPLGMEKQLIQLKLKLIKQLKNEA